MRLGNIFSLFLYGWIESGTEISFDDPLICFLNS